MVLQRTCETGELFLCRYYRFADKNFLVGYVERACETLTKATSENLTFLM